MKTNPAKTAAASTNAASTNAVSTNAASTNAVRGVAHPARSGRAILSLLLSLLTALSVISVVLVTTSPAVAEICEDGMRPDDFDAISSPTHCKYTTAPTPVPTPNAYQQYLAETVAQSRYTQVVTAGDSYSAGVGTHRHDREFDDNGPIAHYFSADTRLGTKTCKREVQTTHGGQMARYLRVPHQVIACGDAEVEYVYNQLKLADIPNDGEGTLMVLSIGGNDARTDDGKSWGEVLKRCIEMGAFGALTLIPFGTLVTDCTYRAEYRSLGNSLPTVARDAEELYTDIVTRYPDISLRVMMYPEIMQGGYSTCHGVTGISGREAAMFDELALELNSALARKVSAVAAATGADIRTFSPVEEFTGHGACRNHQTSWIQDRVSGDRLSPITRRSCNWQRDLEDGRLVCVPTGSTIWSYEEHKNEITGSASFHPNQAGYNAFYRALKQTVSVG